MIKVELSEEALEQLVDKLAQLASENGVLMLKNRDLEKALELDKKTNNTHTLAQWSQVIRLIQGGPSSKIAAIKLVREMTRMGLKESKDLVEGNYR